MMTACGDDVDSPKFDYEKTSWLSEILQSFSDMVGIALDLIRGPIDGFPPPDDSAKG